MSESIDIDWPAALPLPVPLPKHSFRSRNLRTEMDSSRLRIRRTCLEPKELIDVVWNFTNDEYEDFESFFKEDLSNGATAFLIPLIDLVEYKVTFRDAKYRAGRSDNLHTVTAILEVY